MVNKFLAKNSDSPLNNGKADIRIEYCEPEVQGNNLAPDADSIWNSFGDGSFFRFLRLAQGLPASSPQR
jgi:hypothetical protein